MKNKVFYGEYSLMHWIEMILKKQIKLPDYQRYFVWEEMDVINLMTNICHDQFVPPVTIGVFKKDGKTENLILDGQQRLTSILLYYLMVFPNKERFKSALDSITLDENDKELDEDEIAEIYDKLCSWTIRDIVKYGKTKQSILDKLHWDYYKKINNQPLPDSVFQNKYLGFCYLVPENVDQKAQQKYYSSVFRNINKGISLTSQERRDALFYLDTSKLFFLKPEFSNKINFPSAKNKIKRLDFVRYLSLLTQFNKIKNFKKLAQGYRTKMEDFYDIYIYDLVGENRSDIFTPYTEMFKDVDVEKRMKSLEECITELGFNKKNYESIINVDLDFFGLIYFVLFQGKEISFDVKTELQGNLGTQGDVFKTDKYHARNPAALKYLRNRIEESINIYSKYLKP